MDGERCGACCHNISMEIYSMIKYKVNGDSTFNVTAPHNKASMKVLNSNFKLNRFNDLTLAECIANMAHKPPPSRQTGGQVSDNQAFIHYLCDQDYLVRVRVEESYRNVDRLSQLLKEEGIRHQVFNPTRSDWLIVVEHEAAPTDVIRRDTLMDSLWWLK